MATENLQNRYARGLIKLGYVELPARGTRYRCFEKQDCEPDYVLRFVWLGKAGAVRRARQRVLDVTTPATELFKAKLLNAAGEA